MSSDTKKVCTVAACERPLKARSLCSLHYQRYQAHGDPTTVLVRTPDGAEPEVPPSAPAQAQLGATIGRLIDVGLDVPCASGGPAARALWTSDDEEEQQHAAKLCAGCPLVARRPCSRIAEQYPQEWGTYAGTTWYDRNTPKGTS